MSLYGGQLLEHRDPKCTGGFSAILETVPDYLEDKRRPTRLELRCWTCNTVWQMSAWTLATDDPETEGYVAPWEHTPGLHGWSSELRMAASLPAVKVGRVVLQPEIIHSGWHGDPYEYLVTDAAGNVLGTVTRYHTQRGAVRYRWGTTQDVAGHGDGFATPQSAAKQVAAAVLR